MTPELIELMRQFGIAGLVGVLWLWERRFSRKREQELSEAHERLLQQRLELRTLLKLVRRNTDAIARFERTLGQAVELLARVSGNEPAHCDPTPGLKR